MPDAAPSRPMRRVGVARALFAALAVVGVAVVALVAAAAAGGDAPRRVGESVTVAPDAPGRPTIPVVRADIVPSLALRDD